MKIALNGDEREVAAGSTLGDLLVATGYAGRRVAVEINRTIVPRSDHAGYLLRDGDRIEIVHAIGGG